MTPAKDEVTVLEHATLKVSERPTQPTLYSPFFQVPYELLNRKFRGIQKVYDREIASAGNSSGELSTCALKPTGANVREISGLLDGIMQKVTSLKRKAEENTDEELDCTRLCKARLDHLKSYASGTVTSQSFIANQSSDRLFLSSLVLRLQR